LLDQGIDFFGFKLGGEFRHVTFAVADHAAQIVAGHGSGLRRGEGRSGEVAAFGGFAVTLGAIFCVDGICGQSGFRFRRRSLRMERTECKKHGRCGDGEQRYFQLGPRGIDLVKG